MVDLPSSCVTMSPPSTRCGIDYAGPFITRLPARLTRTTYKSYLALCVCLTTKAVHLELYQLVIYSPSHPSLRRIMGT
ncbi:Uncharacterized protein FWK35_00009834 [Aphis craccivora]|uniref:Uncharacterized protein n=1 Tax=Aphis craccivora TaxID=307492 RepID=A0A6G0YQA6_APHCR|nr:Uncharacterized protein FWK35_00009834 [Aphis craccivora]